MNIPSPKNIVLSLAWRGLEAHEISRGIYEHPQSAEWNFIFMHDTAEVCREIAGWDIDGVIGSIRTPEMAAPLISKGIPLISLHGTRPHPSIHLVGPDYAAAGRKAASFFIHQGYPSMAFVSIDQEEPQNLYIRMIREGYNRRAARSGIKAANFPETRAPGLLGNELHEYIAREFTGWIREARRPVGVLCPHDICAAHFCRILHRYDIRVPEEVSVLSIGNSNAFCMSCKPELSSIDIPFRLIGYKAAETMHRLLKPRSRGVKTVLVPPGDVIERNSTGSLHCNDAALAQALHSIRTQRGRTGPITRIAKETGLGRRTLELRFRKHIGHSPRQEVRRVQNLEIMRLLRDTDMTLQEVAERAGLSSCYYLSKRFKQDTGITPSAYRKQFRRK